MLRKSSVLQAVISFLENELSSITQAARAAHEAATHEESRAEDQYDTRGLEASYLAGAQAQRAQEIEAQLTAIRQIPLKEAVSGAAVTPGALVEMTSAGRSQWVLLATRGGGVQVTLEGITVRVISPESPLGGELLGRRVSEEIEIESQNGMRTYQVKAVK